MAPGANWRFDMIGQGPSGEELVTALHFVENSSSTTLAQADADLACQGIEGAILLDYLDCITTLYTYNRSVLTSLTGYTPSVQGVSVLNLGVAGLNAEAAGPIERAAVLRKLTLIPSRRGRGRVFLPMIPFGWFSLEGSLVTGGTAPTLLGVLMATLLANRDPLVGFSLTPAIYHRDTQTSDQIRQMSISPLVGVQRRRRLGVGS